MNQVKTIKELIRREVLAAVSGAIAMGHLPEVQAPVFSVDMPREKSHGDFSANIAMVMQKQVGMAPRAIAQAIADRIGAGPAWLAKTEIAGPGFLNFYLDSHYFHPALEAILS